MSLPLRQISLRSAVLSVGDDEQDLDGDADLGIDDDIPGAIAGDGVGEGADNAVARMPDGLFSSLPQLSRENALAQSKIGYYETQKADSRARSLGTELIAKSL